MKKNLLSFLLIAALTLFTNRGFSQVIDLGEAADFSKSFSLAPGGKLTVQVDCGDVQIVGAEQNTAGIRVERAVTHASDADAAKILKEEHVTIELSGNMISVLASDPPSLHHFFGWHQPNLEVHYEITVPQSAEVNVETEGGGISVANLEGSVKARTEGGSLHFNNMKGKIDGQTEGGDVFAGKCSDELQLKTEAGGITIKEFAGPSVQAATEGGSVSADFAQAPKSDCRLETEGGNVTARLPDGAAMTLDAHTDGGSVKTDLPVQVSGELSGNNLKGTINGGGPVLRLQTEGGNVRVLKR
ncbi:MAG TPA: DUF4097 family beta strand repeat-containing protein [Verrucomicrobiae bacterium]|nr:DUF4097 family beta strand repeat-containing protein [Verrucomicrobiae bacterium]